MIRIKFVGFANVQRYHSWVAFSILNPGNFQRSTSDFANLIEFSRKRASSRPILFYIPWNMVEKLERKTKRIGRIWRWFEGGQRVRIDNSVFVVNKMKRKLFARWGSRFSCILAVRRLTAKRGNFGGAINPITITMLPMMKRSRVVGSNRFTNTVT